MRLRVIAEKRNENGDRFRNLFSVDTKTFKPMFLEKDISFKSIMGFNWRDLSNQEQLEFLIADLIFKVDKEKGILNPDGLYNIHNLRAITNSEDIYIYIQLKEIGSIYNIEFIRHKLYLDIEQSILSNMKYFGDFVNIYDKNAIFD